MVHNLNYPNHLERSENDHIHEREHQGFVDSEYKHDRRLPTETLCRIFKLLQFGSLSAICRVSSRARAIAEPILYVSPSADSPARAAFLVRTFLDRPELMQHVRSISLGLDDSEAAEGLGTSYLPSLLKKVKKIFESGEMQNLRELVWCARGETGWALPLSSTFLPRITHFSTTAATPSLTAFLITHPSITHLTLHSHGMALRLPPYALPHLTHLACAAPALSGLPVHRLKHVVLMDAPFIPLLGGSVLRVLGGDRTTFRRDWRDASPPASISHTNDMDRDCETLKSITLQLGHVIISPVQAPLILEPFAKHVSSSLRKLGIIGGPSFFTRVSFGTQTSGTNLNVCALRRSLRH